MVYKKACYRFVWKLLLHYLKCQIQQSIRIYTNQYINPLPTCTSKCYERWQPSAKPIPEIHPLGVYQNRRTQIRRTIHTIRSGNLAIIIITMRQLSIRSRPLNGSRSSGISPPLHFNCANRPIAIPYALLTTGQPVIPAGSHFSPRALEMKSMSDGAAIHAIRRKSLVGAILSINKSIYLEWNKADGTV